MERAHRRVFELLFVVAYMFHETEEWTHAVGAFVSMAAVAGLLHFEKDRVRHWIFVAFLAFVAFVQTRQFPDLANHSNAFLFLTYFLLPSRLLLCLRDQVVDEESQVRVLRWSALGIYFLAGFHKLNTDFFVPGTGCAFHMADQYFATLGIPLVSWPVELLPILPVGTLLMELGPPLLLIFARTRFVGMALLAFLHFFLAPLGFTDFSSLGMVFLWLFVPPRFLEVYAAEKYVRGASMVFLGMEAGFAFTRWSGRPGKLDFMEGIILGVAFIPLWWNFFRSGLKGETLSFPRRPAHALFLVLLIFFGLNNYLGLRTTGTFSMFSNLRTEGERSNHLLLGSNPLKLFSFQEDVVKILFNDPRVEGYNRRMPSAGQVIPRVEFARLVDKLRASRIPGIGLKIEYRGMELQTADLANDPQFDLGVPAWQKRYLTFRAIDSSGPQRCVW